MKKALFTSLLAALAFGIVACNDNEGEGGFDKADIIGSWHLIYMAENETKDGTLLPRENPAVSQQEMTLTFASKGSYSIEWSYEGELEDAEQGSWSMSGDKLTMSDGLDTIVYTVEALSKTELVIASVDRYEEGGSVFEYTVRMTFSRWSVNGR